MAEVVVTIQSATNYIALIRNKSVVVLGYDQLKDKGITYQAFKEDIEKQICYALKYRVTAEKKSNFERIIAICLKYYFYESQTGNKSYGMNPPENVDGFCELRRMMEKCNENSSISAN